MTGKAPPPLRGYQQLPFRAMLAAAERHDADVVVCRFSRQSGKNELSARFEATLLAAYRGTAKQGVKAAPTQDPQAVRSLKRLAAHLRAAGFRRGRELAAGDQYVRLGEAEWWFGSGEPDANVVGATAGLALEFDEAQDFDADKHDKDYRPMAASTAAATIYYGTAWSDFDVLEVARQGALNAERRDGRRRVFDVPWDRVADEVPAYGLFCEAERARLGHTPATPHPTWLTQYELVPVAGAGRLFSPAQLELLQGDHPALDAPLSASHNTYVAGLDIAGADLSGSGDPDETVLTIGRAQFPGRGRVSEPIVHVVAQYAWRAMDHDAARAEIVRLLDRWSPAYACVDATGIGEPLATHLQRRYGERKVEAFKFSSTSKSQLGYDLIAAVNVGAVRLWRPDGPGYAALWAQLRACRREMKSAGRLDFYVDAKDGHDDRVMSLALLVRAAQRGRPRVARSRSA